MRKDIKGPCYPKREKIKTDCTCIVGNIADLIILEATCSARRRGCERRKKENKRKIPNKPELISPAEILEPNAKQNLKTVNRLCNIIVIFFSSFSPYYFCPFPWFLRYAYSLELFVVQNKLRVCLSSAFCSVFLLRQTCQAVGPRRGKERPAIV